MLNDISTRTKLDVLKTAYNLIEKGWTKGAAARNSRGIEVDSDDPKACRFCAIGALHRASKDVSPYDQQYYKKYDAVLHDVYVSLRETVAEYSYELEEYNDKTTKKKILELFQKTLEKYHVEMDNGNR